MRFVETRAPAAARRSLRTAECRDAGAARSAGLVRIVEPISTRVVRRGVNNRAASVRRTPTSSASSGHAPAAASRSPASTGRTRTVPHAAPPLGSRLARPNVLAGSAASSSSRSQQTISSARPGRASRRRRQRGIGDGGRASGKQPSWCSTSTRSSSATDGAAISAAAASTGGRSSLTRDRHRSTTWSLSRAAGGTHRTTCAALTSGATAGKATGRSASNYC